MVNAADNTLAAAVSRVNAFLATVREDAKAGITWVEFGEILTQLLYMSVSALDAVRSMSGQDKKAIALTAAASFFDTFADRCVSPALYPFWSIVRPGTRTLLLAIASGAIETLLKINRGTDA